MRVEASAHAAIATVWADSTECNNWRGAPRNSNNPEVATSTGGTNHVIVVGVPVVQLGTEPVTSSEVPTAVRVNRSTLEPGGTGTTVTIGSADQLALAGALVAPVGTVPASEGNEESLAALWFWELLQRAGYEVW